MKVTGKLWSMSHRIYEIVRTMAVMMHSGKYMFILEQLTAQINKEAITNVSKMTVQ